MPFPTLTADQKDGADLELLGNACLPSPRERGYTHALRPERPECAAYMQVSTSPRWISALQYIQAGIYLEGESVEDFCNRFHRFCSRAPRALRSVAAILHDQECSGVLAPEAVPTPLDYKHHTCHWIRLGLGIDSLIEKILEVDYDISNPRRVGEVRFSDRFYRRFIWPVVDDFCQYLVEFVNCCRHGQLPNILSWEVLGTRLWDADCALRRGGDSSDVAIMLYYYHTHRRQLSPMDYRDGLTGYTGILQELKDEIPTKGSDRLMRKLSVDINHLIPSFVLDLEKRKKMIATAEYIAAQHNLPVVALAANGREWPEPERKHKSRVEAYAPPAYTP